MDEDMIDTRPFAGRCTITATTWPKGASYRVRLLAVRAGDLPTEVRARLRAAGCGPLDDPAALIPLGQEMALGRPRTTIPVSEIVRLLKAESAPAGSGGPRQDDAAGFAGPRGGGTA